MKSRLFIYFTDVVILPVEEKSIVEVGLLRCYYFSKASHAVSKEVSPTWHCLLVWTCSPHGFLRFWKAVSRRFSVVFFTVSVAYACVHYCFHCLLSCRHIVIFFSYLHEVTVEGAVKCSVVSRVVSSCLVWWQWRIKCWLGWQLWYSVSTCGLCPRTLRVSFASTPCTEVECTAVKCSADHVGVVALSKCFT
jgi:hypothetical protein